MAQSEPGREHSSTHSKPGALNQRSCGGQTNPPLRLSIQAIPSEGFVIGPLMNKLKPATRHRQRAMHPAGVSQSTIEETTLQQLELRHREAMTARERGAVGLVINKRWLHGSIRFVKSAGQ